jgi:hypothetical protein
MAGQHLFLVIGAFLLLPIAGCGTGEPERDGADLNALSTYYLDYARSQRTPPPNEQAFRDFIAEIPAERRQQLNAQDIDTIFVSPRDGKPYVVVYGEETKGEIPDVFAYEQEGADGKRWVARSLGYVSEVEASEFQQLVGN